MATDDQIRAVLWRLEPPGTGSAPDWADVLGRAGRVRAAAEDDGRPAARIRGRKLTRGVLLAAAISAVGVGAAGAAHLLTSSGSLFGRHYPVSRHVAHVRYLHTAAPARLQ